MKTLAKVKFIKSKQGRELLFLPVRVNGKGPFEFVLDTGSAAVCLSRETASTLGIRGRKVKDTWGAGGQTVRRRLSKVKSISIGRAVRRNLGVQILDFKGVGLNEHLERSIEGIIGIEFFETYRMTIDCSRSELLLQKKS